MASNSKGGRKGTPKKKTKAEQKAASDDVLANQPGDVVRAVTAVVIEIIRSLSKGLEWPSLTVMCGTLLGIFYGLPETDRVNVFPKLLETVKELISSGPLPWAGWGLLLLLLVVGAPTIVIMDRRRRTQGTELSQLRSVQNPHRLSSNNEDGLQIAEDEIAARDRTKG